MTCIPANLFPELDEAAVGMVEQTMPTAPRRFFAPTPPYNGYTGPQRDALGNWIRAQEKKGLYSRPDHCCACGLTSIVGDSHAEDYGKPYDIRLLYPLCYTCHIALHKRNDGPTLMQGWIEYATRIREGWQYRDNATRNSREVKGLLEALALYPHTTPAPGLWTMRDACPAIDLLPFPFFLKLKEVSDWQEGDAPYVDARRVLYDIPLGEAPKRAIAAPTRPAQPPQVRASTHDTLF